MWSYGRVEGLVCNFDRDRIRYVSSSFFLSHPNVLIRTKEFTFINEVSEEGVKEKTRNLVRESERLNTEIKISDPSEPKRNKTRIGYVRS